MRRRRLRVALGLALAGLLAGPAAVLGVHVTHPRDVDGFLAYLTQYGDGSSDEPVAVLPATDVLLAEGDRACDWMREQPYALWRTDERFHFMAVSGRHAQHIAGHIPSWGGALPYVGTVATAAWAYLCPAEWELREPRRRPFTPQPD